MDNNINENVRDWYMKAYPTDQEGTIINSGLTFSSIIIILAGLSPTNDIYYWLGVNDSLIRERIFNHLATLLNWNYDKVYELWMKNTDY